MLLDAGMGDDGHGRLLRLTHKAERELGHGDSELDRSIFLEGVPFDGDLTGDGPIGLLVLADH